VQKVSVVVSRRRNRTVPAVEIPATSRRRGSAVRVGHDACAACLYLDAVAAGVQCRDLRARHRRTRHLAGVQRLVVAAPVGLAELLGDDDVQPFADRLLGGVTEYLLGRVVPRADDPVGVRERDRLARLLDDAPTEPLPVDR